MDEEVVWPPKSRFELLSKEFSDELGKWVVHLRDRGTEPLSHEELVRKYSADWSKLPPEKREALEASREWMRELHRSGRQGTPKPGDNFPIGLDDDFKPFPAKRRRDAEGAVEDGEAG
ncbi:hypothetical protein REH65_19670 [Saccharopolyspora sp. ID03-671]|uniref:hypothetical protein n=1 Tax=Saccharopolyspora sp. ID03-671 TaxID=3073066 RepID=UPI003249DC83